MHERDVGLGRRGADDDLLGSGREVLAGLLAGVEEARRLDDDLDPEVRPRQRAGVALGQHPHRLAVDDETVVAVLDRAAEAAVHGVVLQQVGQRGGVGDVVHRDDLDALCAVAHCTKDVAADPAEPVDSYPYAHEMPPGGRRREASLDARSGNPNRPTEESGYRGWPADSGSNRWGLDPSRRGCSATHENTAHIVVEQGFCSHPQKG